MSESPHLQEVPWIANLTPVLQRELEQNVQLRRLRRERTLYYQNDAADMTFFVIRGSVRIVKWTDNDSTVLVNTVDQGGWFGLAEAVIRGVYLADAVTITESVVASIHVSNLVRLMSHEAIRARVIHELATGQYVLHGIIGAHSPQAKIARHLASLISAEFEADDIAIGTTQEEIAKAVGLSRETVNRHLNELQNAGVIDLGRGEIRVVDASRLNTLPRSSSYHPHQRFPDCPSPR